MRCQKCGHENPAAARFCASCGARLALACPGCGAAVETGQRFCTACGRDLTASTPRPSEPLPAVPTQDEGERRQATVVFSDLSGYTALNERIDPEEVEQIMNRVKREATAIIERHGGTVNQFVGDEVLALFGIPVARRDDPRRAVIAALELHRAVRAISAELEARVGRPLTMHTGVNTGLIVTRRSDAREGRFALTGDTVNTGARLLGLANADEIVVGPETWRQIAPYFDAEAGQAIEVKGKARPIVPYRIRGECAAGEAARRPIVGRSEELRGFTALAQACLDRRRGRVLIARGDPGIGKSRLLEEFASLARSLGFACHAALVLDFGAERGSDAIRSLVRGILEVPMPADEQALRAAVARACAEGLLARDRELFLYDLLDLTPPQALRAIHAALSAAARDRGSLETLREIVRRAAERRPQMLLVEDIHWADSWTLDRLAALAGIATERPVLLAMSTRFEGDPTAGPWRGALHGIPCSSIDLGALPEEDALRLASSLTAMPEALVRRVVERAEGNALFLEQLLLNAEEAAQANLPGSIQALVLARMDRLPGADRSALQAASVLGQRFAPEALRHLVEDPSYNLGVLVEHFLVRPEGMEFLFCHALIRDGAYESLLKSRRRLLHARAAGWFAERDTVLAAEHYDRAESPLAPRAYLAACDAEGARFRYERALQLAERGLALASEREDRFALTSARGRMLHDMGRAEASIAAYSAALEVSSGPVERARALIGLAAGMRILDRYDDGLAAAAEAEPLAREAGLAFELSRLHHLRGNLYFPLGRIDECLREHEFALRHARASGSLEAEASALGGLGDAHYLRGRMRSSHEEFRRCAALCRANGFGRLEVAILHMLGWTAEYLNEFGYALGIGHEAIDLAVKVSHRRAEVLARHLVGLIGCSVTADQDGAMEQLEAALPLAQALGAKRFEAQNYMFRALVAMHRGQGERAYSLANQGLEVARTQAMGFTGPWLMAVIAQVAPERSLRSQALAEGERLLRAGCVSHNHFRFGLHAIDASLEDSDWDLAERYCAGLEGYAAAEPLPWVDFVVARGRALARFGRGERGEDLAATLGALSAEGARIGFRTALPAIEQARAVSQRG